MNNSGITLNDILNSKVYLKEGSAISFNSPRAYVEPFLEKFANLNVEFKTSVSGIVANKNADDDKRNEAYARVLIEAKFPQEYCAKNHDSVIGMVYALDTQKPSIRIYSGQNAWACTNLAIFGARYIHQVELISGIDSIYEKSLDYVEGLTTQLARFQEVYEKMNDIYYEGDQIDRILGHVLREAYKNKSIGTNPVLAALKDLEDPKSRYSIRDGKTNQWNIYSALTQYVTDKTDIFDKSMKTVSLSNIFVKEM